MAASLEREAFPTTEVQFDDVIVALDHQRVGEGAGSWVVEVLGVHSAGSDLWVQIARNGEPDDTLVLHVLPEATVGDALAALTTARPAWTSLPHVLDAPPRH